ncbi:sporulation peptidase YabG [Halothermothrix orenii]|uniref:Peptidase U57 YabG n=1 Tax=Halothermothrix orenii (strain H 168 / OCM 544 / DSM 9562) TaxID=373903 RepID=B8D0I0_HALOH|nr:sporulation peptidase YabG [Halothermothrix orenii]ACL70916.1 peptidase U57 YabG [Halothermothrix orenii H 168]
MSLNKGDFVTRRSHNRDLVFRIEDIKRDKVILRSFKFRLMADAPLDDLIKVDTGKITRIKKNLHEEALEILQKCRKHLILNTRVFRNSNSDAVYTEYPVRVLHLDGDKEYLNISLQNYKNLGLKARGFFIPEEGQPEKISRYVTKYRPDILVLTGHDGEFGDKIYHTSRYFIKAVKIARKIEPDLDQLIIYAGACQSDYDKLIESGANFASSPQNKMIHFMEPVLLVEKIASTPFNTVVPVSEVTANSISGEGAIGGVETRGKLRKKYP